MELTGDFAQKQDVSISRLTNSIEYLIDTCFIMDLSGTTQGKNKYRLLAFHQNAKKIYVDKYFPTLRGARIAFKRQFNSRACIADMSANWSDLYPPDCDWIDDMLSIVKNLKSN